MAEIDAKLIIYYWGKDCKTIGITADGIRADVQTFAFFVNAAAHISL